MSPELLFPGRHAIRLALVLFLASGAAACDSSSGSDPPGPAALVQVVSGDAQQTTVGAELPEPLIVRVMDADDRPVRDQRVQFVVVSGGGSVSAGSALTDRDGEVRERWTLGTVAGDTQRVEARVLVAGTGEAISAQLHAVGTAAPADAVETHGAPATQGRAGATLPDEFAVRVLDAFGNPVPQVPVTWQVPAGGGTAAPHEPGTSAAGVAAARWTLGLRVGPVHRLRALTPVGTVEFSATATMPRGAVVEAVSGSGQTGVVGRPLAQPLVARVGVADGRPVPGATVRQVDAPGSGILAPPTAVTDELGRAVFHWTLPQVAGTPRVAIEAPGANGPAEYTATATPGDAATLGAIALTGSTNAGVGADLRVRVSDAWNNPVPGAVVTWASTTEPGTLSPTTIVTDASGTAATRWVPTKRGRQEVTASTPGVSAPAVLRAYIWPGPPVTLEAEPAELTLYPDYAGEILIRMLDQFGQVVSPELVDMGLVLTSSDPSVLQVPSESDPWPPEGVIKAWQVYVRGVQLGTARMDAAVPPFGLHVSVEVVVLPDAP